MTRRNTKSQAAVERLLDERRQYETWLAKLAEQTAASAPSHVVDRVKADYKSRLDSVIKQLARYEGELETALAEMEARRDDLVKQRAGRAETLAEAELRHQVGEYDEGKFAELSAEQTAALAQLGEEIVAAERDIARYEEILGLIAGALPEIPAGPPVPAPPPSAPVAFAPTPPPALAAPLPAAAPPAPEAAVAAGPTGSVVEGEAAAAGKAATHGKPLDELEFIRSVAAAEAADVVEVSAPTAAAPAKPAERLAPAPPPAPGKREGPAPVRNGARGAPAAPQGQGLPELVGRVVPEMPGEPAKESRSLRKTTGEADPATKTLRCTECGTNNLPTEWYCEKCGAELSAF